MSNQCIVRTVRGDIPAEDLGICYPHEHLFGSPPQDLATQDLTLNDPEVAIQETLSFRAAGGRAIVDMSTMDYNRDAVGLKRVSEQTNVHVIAATGFNKDTFSKRIVDTLSDQQLYDLLYKDVTVGMDGTGIRAGVLKASSMLDSLSDTARRVFEMVAAVHKETGVPVSTHTEAGTMAMEQVDLLVGKGVSPESIVIGHLDRKLEVAYIRDVAQTGVFLGFDQISKEKYYPDRLRIEVIKTLIREGYGKQILLSSDMARRSYWPSYGSFGGPGFTFILWRFLPWLREEGLDEHMLTQLVEGNPRQALSFKPLV